MGQRFQSAADPDRATSSTASASKPARRATIAGLAPRGTVALPGSTSIAYGLAARTLQGARRNGAAWRRNAGLRIATRSEERRVGKECRARGERGDRRRQRADSYREQRTEQAQR